MAGKVAVMGLLERHGKDGAQQVRTRRFCSSIKRRTCSRIVRRARRSWLDRPHRCAAAPISRPRRHDYIHNVIDHAEAYVDGQVHTNGWKTSGAS